MYRDQPTPSSFEACGRLGSAFCAFRGRARGFGTKVILYYERTEKIDLFRSPLQSRSRGRWREKYTRILYILLFFFTASTRLNVVRHQDEVSPPTTTNRAKRHSSDFLFGWYPGKGTPKSQIAFNQMVACTHMDGSMYTWMVSGTSVVGDESRQEKCACKQHRLPLYSSFFCFLIGR